MSDEIDSFADLIGLENKPTEVEEYKEKSLIPDMFAFLASVGETKEELIREQDLPQETLEKAYPAWQINRGLSMGADSILYANEMNRLYGLSNDAQYRYYKHALPARKRYNKWAKRDKDDDIILVARHYQCNISIAKQLIKVLGAEGLEALHNKTRTGGSEAGKRNKK